MIDTLDTTNARAGSNQIAGLLPRPGVAVMVARRGQIGWFDAIGRQNPAASAPMAHDSIFRIFSMTKPIVSVGIMMLVEDGYFVLGDPVAKVIELRVAADVHERQDGNGVDRLRPGEPEDRRRTQEQERRDSEPESRA